MDEDDADSEDDLARDGHDGECVGYQRRPHVRS